MFTNAEKSHIMASNRNTYKLNSRPQNISWRLQTRSHLVHRSDNLYICTIELEGGYMALALKTNTWMTTRQEVTAEPTMIIVEMVPQLLLNMHSRVYQEN